MPWLIGLLLSIMAVVPLTSSLRPDTEVFSETGSVHEVSSGDSIRFGKLLIGTQGIVSDNEMATPELRSAKSDESSLTEKARFNLAKAKLQRLSPLVHCGNDSMTLRVPGPRVPHFLVDQGEGSPVPLSEMPARCGFSLKRARRDVSLVAPYSGCNVRKQGGHYILPLIIMGAPVQMSCPVGPRLPKVSCFSSAMIVSLGISADNVQLKVDGSWEPLLLVSSQCSITLESVDDSVVLTVPFTGSCWEMTDSERLLPLMYGGREVTLSCPVTESTVAPTVVQDSLDMPPKYPPFPLGSPWWYPPYFPDVPQIPATLPPPTTTAAPLPGFLQQQMFPHMYPNPYYFYPKVNPAQHPWNPMFPPYMPDWQSTVEPTTPAPTTAAPAQQQAAYPIYPMYPGAQYPMYPGAQYPMYPGAQYPKNPGAQYPKNPGAQYPKNPGAQYPKNPGAQYPKNPGAQYPKNPGAQYPKNPGAQYPKNPGAQYPKNPGAQYPKNPGAQYPKNPFFAPCTLNQGPSPQSSSVDRPRRQQLQES